MTENRVGFLCNVAFNFPLKNETYKVLRSYYLLRCHDMTKGKLPSKLFSSKTRCPHCYLDWTRDSDVKVQPIKLSKRQRQKVRSQKQSKYTEPITLLQNEMVQVCTFCKQSTSTRLMKPEKNYKSTTPKELTNLKANKLTTQMKTEAATKKIVKKKNTITNSDKKNNLVNLYSNAFDAFSLKNEKNTLSSTIKVPPKVIKNNKKKKVKFAGLCEKAVLASAKLKEQKEKLTPKTPQDKLSLFLKPSSG